LKHLLTTIQIDFFSIFRLYGAKGEGCDPYKAKDEL
jgi:hypothetical protein